MKIGEYEVTVVDKDTVKVGCQVVSREQAKRILEEMDKWQAGTLITEIPIGIPHVALSGGHSDQLYIRANNEVVALGHTMYGTICDYPPDMRLRPLRPNEQIILEGDGTCKLVNTKSK